MKEILLIKFIRNLICLGLLCLITISCSKKEKIENGNVDVTLDSVYFHKRIEWSTTKPEYIELSLKIRNNSDSVIEYDLLKKYDTLPRFYLKTESRIVSLAPRTFNQDTKGVLQSKDSVNLVFEIKTPISALDLVGMYGEFLEEYSNETEIVLEEFGNRSLKFEPDLKEMNPVFILDLERISKEDTLKMRKGGVDWINTTHNNI